MHVTTKDEMEVWKCEIKIWWHEEDFKCIADKNSMNLAIAMSTSSIYIHFIGIFRHNMKNIRIWHMEWKRTSHLEDLVEAARVWRKWKTIVKIYVGVVAFVFCMWELRQILYSIFCLIGSQCRFSSVGVMCWYFEVRYLVWRVPMSFDCVEVCWDLIACERPK